MMTYTARLAPRFLAALSLAFFLSSCLSATTQRTTEAPATITPMAEIPAEPPPYRLQVGDVMDIKLLLNPELNDQVTVRPDGMISTAIATDVKAYGRTPGELQKDLEDRYNKQLVKPRLAVIVRSFAPSRIYVTGEVNNPGEFITVGPTLTLMQAIARAGGVKNTAGTDKILILRREAGDKPVAYSANYSSAISGTSAESDVRLAPFDVVYVPRSGVADVYLNFQQYVQQFVPVSFGANYQLNNNANNR